MRKLDFCVFENKGADQLCSNCTADQRLCFHFMDSTLLLLPKSKTSSFWPSSVAVQAGLCQTWVITLKTGFLTPEAHLNPCTGNTDLTLNKCVFLEDLGLMTII